MRYGSALPRQKRRDGSVAVYGSAGRIGEHDEANTSSPVIVIGRKGSYGKVSYSSDPVFVIDTAYFVDPSCTGANLRWLRYVLEVAGLDRLSRDVGVPGLSRELAYAARVPVMPLGEQRRIADFLDREMAMLDRLTRLKEELATRLSERRTAAMQAAIAGMPRNAKLGYVGSWFSGGTPPKEENEHWAGPMPWASTKDLTSDELLDTIDHVTQQAAEQYSRVAPGGSLLIATRGMALAKRLPLAVTRNPAAFNQDLKALVPRPGIEADYLRIVLRGCESELLASVVESAHGTRRLETRHLKALRVPIPSPEVQRRIVDEVGDAEATTEALERAVQRQLDLLQERRQALIVAAVAGQLQIPSSPDRAPAVAV